MELLPINLPNFSRIQYANKECQDIWEPKINTGSKLYPQLEFLTVKHGVRKCMIDHAVDPSNLDVKMRELNKDGLIFVPLQKEAIGSGSFSHVSSAYNGNGNFGYRAVIARSVTDAEEFIHAHFTNDDIKIGELLGFPKSSCEFFDDVWKQGYVDPIWQQAENTTSPEILKNRRDFEDPLGNIEKKLIRFKSSDENYKILSAFRYIGIRILSHFPRSFDDKESIKVANEWIDLARQLNLEGLDETLEILQLPFEWDCLKGAVTINTPVMKIVTNSVPCFPNHIIQQESDLYPKEAPNGIRFPWTISPKC